MSKRRTNIKVEEINTDMGLIEIELRPDNTFYAHVGLESVFADSMDEIKSQIYGRVKSLLHVDFRPVIEVQGTTINGSSGSYATDSIIRTSFFIHAHRYHLGVRSNNGGRSHTLCRLDWTGMFGMTEDMTPQEIARNTHDYSPLSWVARSKLGIDRLEIGDDLVKLFSVLPVAYLQPQGFDFELVVDYTPEFWAFLNKAHVTIMNLFEQIQKTVSTAEGIKRIESGFLSILPKLTP